MNSRFLVVCAVLGSLLLSAGLAAEKTDAFPSGPQTDGSFRKVILESDHDIDGDGTIDDSIKDPMELSVAKDGRVFFIQRFGIISVIEPGSTNSRDRKSVV